MFIFLNAVMNRPSGGQPIVHYIQTRLQQKNQFFLRTRKDIPELQPMKTYFFSAELRPYSNRKTWG